MYDFSFRNGCHWQHFGKGDEGSKGSREQGVNYLFVGVQDFEPLQKGNSPSLRLRLSLSLFSFFSFLFSFKKLPLRPEFNQSFNLHS